jgi:hypothetical protein
MTAQKPEWFELTENTPASGIRKVDKKLPIAAIVLAGAVLVAGSIFANAGDGPAAVADTQQSLTTTAPAAVQPPAVSKSAAPAPQISTSPQDSLRGRGHEGREHEGNRWGDHEGREHDGDRGGDDD